MMPDPPSPPQPQLPLIHDRTFLLVRQSARVLCRHPPGSPLPHPQSVSRVLLQSCLSFAYFFLDYVEEEEEEE